MRMDDAHGPEGVPSTLPGLTAYLMPLAVRSRHDYDTMVQWIDRLAVLQRRTKAQQRFLDTLTILVEDYERTHHPIDPETSTPLDVLKYLLEENQLSGRALGRILGQPQLGGRILRGERQLSKAHIRKLAQHFAVSPALFF